MLPDMVANAVTNDVSIFDMGFDFIKAMFNFVNSQCFGTNFKKF